MTSHPHSGWGPDASEGELAPEERRRFVKAFCSRTFNFTDPCAFLAVSRKNGYKRTVHISA